MTENEVWKKIAGYSKYYVSNYGRIKNSDYKRSGQEFIMSPGRIRNGYVVVVLSQNAMRKTYLLHRLVAEYFISNIDNKPQVNHRDGNKMNNNVSNLEWVTRKENVKHSFECLGRVSSTLGEKGALSRVSKPVIQYAGKNKIFEYGSIKEAYEATNISVYKISQCCKGITQTAGGYNWMYKPK